MKLALVSFGWSTTCKFHCGIVTNNSHSIVDEVSGTVLGVIGDLKGAPGKLLVWYLVGSNHPQYIHSRLQIKELSMSIGTYTEIHTYRILTALEKRTMPHF